jgi:pyrimidine-nucleoside phosphorylase
MNTPELIRRKRSGGSLEAEEMEQLIAGYLAGDVEEYQISALLMAIYFKGMEPDEAAALARVMRDSGRKFDLSDIDGPKVDKHSTGGVGDKVSLLLLPLIAEAGGIDPMVSGRGLGHTGGTLDKLDAIPGYRWNLDNDEMKGVLRRVGGCIIGQTDDFVPADKRIYALRDVTATVESIPLICASILSKKAAAGVESLVMDVKSGSGAFIDDDEQSRELARQLVRIGTSLGMKVSALRTRMDQPLGRYVGNALEVVEILDLLEGNGPDDTRDVALELSAEMLVLGGLHKTREEALAGLRGILDSGLVRERFVKWIEAQHGNPRILDDRSLLPAAPDRDTFVAPASGIIGSINTRTIGVAANTLGAGRFKTSDKVDLAVGFEVHAKVGDKVKAGDTLLTIHHRNGKGLGECKRLLARAYTIGDKEARPMELVAERIG